MSQNRYVLDLGLNLDKNIFLWYPLVNIWRTSCKYYLQELNWYFVFNVQICKKNAMNSFVIMLSTYLRLLPEVRRAFLDLIQDQMSWEKNRKIQSCNKNKMFCMTKHIISIVKRQQAWGKEYFTHDKYLISLIKRELLWICKEKNNSVVK